MLSSFCWFRRLAAIGFAFVGWSALAAPPALSPKVNDLIDRFFSPLEFKHLQLSPSGARVSLEKEMSGQWILATIDTQTGVPAVAAPSPRQNIWGSHWVGPDQLVFYILEEYKPTLTKDTTTMASMLPNTEKPVTFYAGHWVANGDLTRMQEVPAMERVLELADPVPQDPSRTFFVEQSSDKFYSPLYCYDLTKNKTRRFEANPGRVVDWHTDTAGKVRLATVAEDHGKWSLIYRPTEEAPWQPLAAPASTDFVAFDRTGKTVILSYPDQNGRAVSQSFDLESRKFVGEAIANPVYDVSPEPICEPRTNTPVGLTYETDRPQFAWFDPGFEKLQAFLSKAMPGSVVLPLGGTATGEILIETKSDVAPTRYYVFNPQAGKLRLLADQQPKVKDLKLAAMKPIEFTTSAGVTLYGYLTLPPGQPEGRGLPMIALVHGGPRTRDHWGYDPEVQYFAALGYAVLQINYRGSTGYGDAYALKNVIEVGEHSVDDVAAGLRWAVDQGIADPKRLVVCGASYGGYIALGVATRYPDLAAGVVGFAGVYDWENATRADYENLNEGLKWMADYYPSVKTSGPQYRAISPVHQAAVVKVPVLLLHGRNDRRVDVAQSQLMARALRSAGKDVEIFADTTGVHGLPDEKLRRRYYERVTTFLLKCAPPDKAP